MLAIFVPTRELVVEASSRKSITQSQLEILDNLDKKINISFSINRQINWSEKSIEYFNKIQKTE